MIIYKKSIKSSEKPSHLNISNRVMLSKLNVFKGWSAQCTLQAVKKQENSYCNFKLLWIKIRILKFLKLSSEFSVKVPVDKDTKSQRYCTVMFSVK